MIPCYQGGIVNIIKLNFFHVSCPIAEEVASWVKEQKLFGLFAGID